MCAINNEKKIFLKWVRGKFLVENFCQIINIAITLFFHKKFLLNHEINLKKRSRIISNFLKVKNFFSVAAKFETTTKLDSVGETFSTTPPFSGNVKEIYKYSNDLQF